MTKRTVNTPPAKSGGIKSSTLMMEALKKGEKPKPLSAQQQYQKIFDQKMQEKMKELAMGGGKTPSFQLPGVGKKQEKNVSAAVKKMMEKIIGDKLERKNKKLQEEVQIHPKLFSGQQGGRIDKDGNIFNINNQIVLKVDKKTGKIVNNSGVAIGKYVPHSPTCEFSITRFIAKTNAQANRGGVGAAGNPGANAAVPAWDAMTGGLDTSGKPSSGNIWSTKPAKKKKDVWW